MVSGNMYTTRASHSSERTPVQFITPVKATIQNDANGCETVGVFDGNPTYTLQQSEPSDLVQLSAVTTFQLQ